MHIALYELTFNLQHSLQILRDSFRHKAVEFKDILKMGRTHLQDAVPMTLGQAFKTYATMIDGAIFRLSRAQDMLKEVN
ncbi:lyase family protein, partial [Aliarcobacter butzleri]|uniref:lyase family protein n=1 Tax=Aliarcobacter butzleri TaxID=28197 RepID=UPI003B21DED4